MPSKNDQETEDSPNKRGRLLFNRKFRIIESSKRGQMLRKFPGRGYIVELSEGETFN